MLVVLGAGLVGFTRLAPWAPYLVVGALALCLLPLARVSSVAGMVSFGDADGPAPVVAPGRFDVPLTRLQAPSLAISLPIPVDLVTSALLGRFVLGVWPPYRTVARDHPLGRATLRVRRIAVAVCAALFVVPAAATARYLIDLNRRTTLSETDAEERVAWSVPGAACSRSSAVVEAPLVRPFYAVAVVIARAEPAAGNDRVVVGLRRVDASRGTVELLGLRDALAEGAASAEVVCARLTVGAGSRTATELG